MGDEREEREIEREGEREKEPGRPGRISADAGGSPRIKAHSDQPFIFKVSACAALFGELSCPLARTARS